MRRLVLLCAVLAVAGCTHPVVTSCPAIRAYTPAEEDALANALDALPDNSPIVEPMLEWAKLRGELASCQSKPS
jgi:hypothetical protein